MTSRFDLIRSAVKASNEPRAYLTDPAGFDAVRRLQVPWFLGIFEFRDRQRLPQLRIAELLRELRDTTASIYGEEMLIYKFRSMTVCEDGAVVPQATREDRCVTRLRRFLRRTWLDELPQILNALEGKMSFCWCSVTNGRSECGKSAFVYCPSN